MKWISIKDDSPEKFIPVLAIVEHQPEIIIASICNSGSWAEQSEYEERIGDAYTSHNLDSYKITHWMLLPEPPE